MAQLRSLNLLRPAIATFAMTAVALVSSVEAGSQEWTWKEALSQARAEKRRSTRPCRRVRTVCLKAA